MSIRKRRRKLTTLMSRLDQRVKSVELRPITLLTSDQITAAVAAGETTATEPQPTAVLAGEAPTFVKIQDAYIYPNKVTGAGDRVEIYLEADLNVAKGDILHVSGIHATSTTPLDATGESFAVTSVDTPPWDGRKFSTGYQKDDPSGDQLSGVTISNTYSFKPETSAPTSWTKHKQLRTKRQVATYAISGTTVTLVMNADHSFEVGDIVFVDIFAEDSRAYGEDGLFKITSVTSNTLTYTLSAGVATPVAATTPNADFYVYPVAKKFLAVGSTWANSSSTTVYYWDGIRWVDYSTVVDPIRDGDPPAAPTNLQITSEGVISTNLSVPSASVKLTWSAPTLTKAGKTLTDLVGYKIYWRKTANEDWRVKQVLSPSSASYTFAEDVLFLQGTKYYFKVSALDSGLQESDAVSGQHTTTKKSTPITAVGPTAPIIESKLGTMTVTWDGYLATTPPSPVPDDVLYLQIHRSTVSGFTPSTATRVATISAVANNYAIFADVQYGVDYYFKFLLTDTSGNISLESAQATARVTPLVDTDLLVGNVLNNWAFNGNLISAGALANGSVNAASLLGPNVVTQNAISANAIGANQIAAGAIIAGKIGADAVTANTVAANAIYAGAIQANAIEADKIKVGALDGKLITGATIRTGASNPRVEMNSTGLYGYNSSGGITFRVLSSDGSVYLASGVQIGGYATSGDLSAVSNTATIANTTANNAKTVADGKLGPGQAASDINNNTTTIDGGKITTGTIDANKIKADSLLAGTIRTGPTNTARIEIRGKDHPNPGIVGYKTSTATAFRLYSNGDSYLDDVNVAGDLSVSGTITAGSTVIGPGYVSGGVLRTSGSWPRMEVSGSTSSIRGRWDASIEARLTSAAWGMWVSKGSFSVVGIATGNTASYHIRGDAFSGEFVRGSQFSSSDIRLKTNIVNSSLGLDFVNNIQTVEYSWVADTNKKRNLGVIAQDVKAVLDEQYPDFSEYFVQADGVEKLPDGTPAYGVQYNRFIPVLLNAVRELSAQVDELKAEIASLKEGNNG